MKRNERLVKLVCRLSILVLVAAAPMTAVAGSSVGDKGTVQSLGSGGGSILSSIGSDSVDDSGRYITVDPARVTGPSGIEGLTAQETLDLDEAMDRCRDLLAAKGAEAEDEDEGGGEEITLDDSDWANLTSDQRAILTFFNITKDNVHRARIKPYFHLVSMSGATTGSRKNWVPKKIYVVNHRMNPGEITYRTKKETRYRDVSQQEILYGPVCGGCQNGVSVWSGNRGVPPPSGGGCCTMVPKGVRTITVREAYQVNIQVPAAQKVPVNAITANKKGRRHTIITPRLVRYQVNVQQTEVLYGPVCGGCQNGVSVWSGNRGVPPPSGGGCCTMVPKGTRVTWVKEWRQRTEYDRSQVPALTAQLPQYHNTKAGDGYKANLYTTKGPDSDGNVVIDTEEDGTLIDATQDQLDSQYQHPDRSYMQDSTKFDNSKVLDHQNGTD